VNLDGVERLANDKRTRKSGPEPWRPPVLGDFPDGEVVAIDQSLTHTGLVHLRRDEHGLRVLQADTIRQKATEGLTGYEESLAQAMALQDLLGVRLDHWIGMKDVPVVYEAVPFGGHLRSPESSLLAALVVRHVVAGLALVCVPPVAGKTHKKVVCGNGNADKRQAHAGLLRLSTDLPIEGCGVVTNEHTRDALSVGLAYLLRDD
jgi:hypothetical protein